MKNQSLEDSESSLSFAVVVSGRTEVLCTLKLCLSLSNKSHHINMLNNWVNSIEATFTDCIYKAVLDAFGNKKIIEMLFLSLKIL